MRQEIALPQGFDNAIVEFSQSGATTEKKSVSALALPKISKVFKLLFLIKIGASIIIEVPHTFNKLILVKLNIKLRTILTNFVKL